MSHAYIVYTGNLELDSLVGKSLCKLKSLKIENSFEIAKEWLDSYIEKYDEKAAFVQDKSISNAEVSLMYKSGVMGYWIVRVEKNSLLTTYRPEEKKVIYKATLERSQQSILLGVCDSFNQARELVCESSRETSTLGVKENVTVSKQPILKVNGSTYYIERE